MGINLGIMRAKTIFFIVVFSVCVANGQEFKFNEISKDTAFVDSASVIDTLKEKFLGGVELYNRQEYSSAWSVFRDLISISPDDNRYYTASFLMLIKSTIRVGKYRDAIELARRFLREFPESGYRDDVLYSVGDAFLLSGEYDSSFVYYAKVVVCSDDQRLIKKAIDMIDVIADFNLGIDSLEKLKSDVSGPENAIVVVKLAEKYGGIGLDKEGIRELKSVRKDLKRTAYDEYYKEVYRKIKAGGDKKYYIGVILPLTGDLGDVGSAILDGAKYSLMQFRRISDVDVSFIIFDNNGDIYKTIHQIDYISKNRKIVCVFGPVKSENCVPAGIIANERRLPLVTPTATDSRITGLGQYVFQANVDFVNAGYMLAKYARETLNIKNLVSLAPLDEYGKEITDAFCEAFDLSGGNILTQQWYYEPDDLSRQLKTVRRIGLELARKQLMAKISVMKDSLQVLINSDSSMYFQNLFSVNDSLYNYVLGDSIVQMTLEEVLVFTGLMDSVEFEIPERDTLGFKLTTIQGIFLPVHTPDIDYVLPQIAYYNIDAVLLGDGNWYDDYRLARDRSYVGNLVFISDYYIDRSKISYRNMAVGFRAKFGRFPGRFELYGYDTMNAILSCIGDGDISRESLRNRLSGLELFRGIARNISFTGVRPRVNSSAFVLKYDGSKIVPVANIENGQVVQR